MRAGILLEACMVYGVGRQGELALPIYTDKSQHCHVWFAIIPSVMALRHLASVEACGAGLVTDSLLPAPHGLIRNERATSTILQLSTDLHLRMSMTATVPVAKVAASLPPSGAKATSKAAAGPVKVRTSAPSCADQTATRRSAAAVAIHSPQGLHASAYNMPLCTPAPSVRRERPLVGSHTRAVWSRDALHGVRVGKRLGGGRYSCCCPDPPSPLRTSRASAPCPHWRCPRPWAPSAARKRPSCAPPASQQRREAARRRRPRTTGARCCRPTPTRAARRAAPSARC